MLLDVVADSRPAIALYEQAGWRLACTQPAWWTDPDGRTPTIRCYLRPRPLVPPASAPPAGLSTPVGRTQVGGSGPAGLSFPLVPNGPWFPPVFPARATAGRRTVLSRLPATAQGPGTGTLAAFAVSQGARERKGA